MQVRNRILLGFCQPISTRGSIVMLTLGGIIDATLTTNKALSTLPMSIRVVAIAATTIRATV